MEGRGTLDRLNYPASKVRGWGFLLSGQYTRGEMHRKMETLTGLQNLTLTHETKAEDKGKADAILIPAIDAFQTARWQNVASHTTQTHSDALVRKGAANYIWKVIDGIKNKRSNETVQICMYRPGWRGCRFLQHLAASSSSSSSSSLCCADTDLPVHPSSQIPLTASSNEPRIGDSD